MTVKQYADEFDLWPRIETAVEKMFLNVSISDFLEQIAAIPIKKSHATRRLGAYVSQGGEPVCIRLQFAQEADSLQQTFLHEVAHACDHLSRDGRDKSYRRAHGSSWRSWANALGVSSKSCGESEAVRDLHQQRLKLVAVCQKCGAEFHRVRRLNRNRKYTHQRCGGILKTV